ARVDGGGRVVWAPEKSLWFGGMAAVALAGAVPTFSWGGAGAVRGVDRDHTVRRPFGRHPPRAHPPIVPRATLARAGAGLPGRARGPGRAAGARAPAPDARHPAEPAGLPRLLRAPAVAARRLPVEPALPLRVWRAVRSCD